MHAPDSSVSHPLPEPDWVDAAVSSYPPPCRPTVCFFPGPRISDIGRWRRGGTAQQRDEGDIGDCRFLSAGGRRRRIHRPREREIDASLRRARVESDIVSTQSEARGGCDASLDAGVRWRTSGASGKVWRGTSALTGVTIERRRGIDRIGTPFGPEQ